jgi:hypothetical protein
MWVVDVIFSSFGAQYTTEYKSREAVTVANDNCVIYVGNLLETVTI